MVWAQQKKADLKGDLSLNRQSFDVRKYEITVQVNPSEKSIVGSNKIIFKTINKLNFLQLDLFKNLTIDSIVYKRNRLKFNRVKNTFFVKFKNDIQKNQLDSVEIFYHGNPIEAKKAPWDGGFVWSMDSTGSPWVGLACEGIGASCWLPCKDHWSDEPEEVLMHLRVPAGLVGVSNGTYLSQDYLPNNYIQYNWYVSYPINHYNISINIGNYINFSDEFKSSYLKVLKLNYFVLRYNMERASTHFQQVKRMLACFEKHVGEYPFYNDGYKLVETPYWGMEHQSCIAYGNNYQFNNFGFDFIIIHESGHEWFANSLTAADPADVWIHESFTTYLESIYVECMYGKARAIEYIETQRKNIKNIEPMVGTLNVYWRPNDNDVYYKGAWMLHTLRNIINNDTLWFNSLKDLTTNFKHKTITTQQVIDFLSVRLKSNLQPFFSAYLFNAKLPAFEYFIVNKDNVNELHYRINADVRDLQFPIKVKVSKDRFEFITATKNWQLIDLNYFDPNMFEVDNNFLVNIVKVKP